MNVDGMLLQNKTESFDLIIQIYCRLDTQTRSIFPAHNSDKKIQNKIKEKIKLPRDTAFKRWQMILHSTTTQ